MSDDSTWDSYSAGDSAAIVPEASPTLDVDALQADVAPIIDAAAVDDWQGDNAVSWGDWNQATADDAAQYAASEVNYANELYAAGFDEAGDAALARAELSADVAADHDETAAGYYDTAASEYQSAADGYGTAADTYADTSAYETTSYDTTSYDTTSYDTAAVDTTVADTSYDATTE